MQADPEVPSIIQHAWDQQLKEHSAVFLILTGSLAGNDPAPRAGLSCSSVRPCDGQNPSTSPALWGARGTHAPLPAGPAGGLSRQTRVCCPFTGADRELLVAVSSG